MVVRSNCGSLLLRATGVVLFLVLGGVRASAQGDDIPAPSSIIDPNTGVSTNIATLTAAGSHVFVSVRGVSGIPLTVTAMVGLNCPLTLVNLSRPARDDGPVGNAGRKISFGIRLFW